MSTTFDETARAIAADPELRAKILAVNTAEERRDILVAAGVPVPTHDDVNAHAALAGVAGGSSTNSGLIVGTTATPVAAAGAAAA
jgi:hypothetical protein